jgi:cellulose binding protein with CBM2 domain
MRLPLTGSGRRPHAAAAALTAAAALVLPVTAAQSAHADAGSACTAVYTVTSSWAGNAGKHGFLADVALTSNGTAPTNGWTVTWTFPGDTQVSNSFNALVTQSGANATATNPNYYAVLQVGTTIHFGLIGVTSDLSAPALTCTAA